MVSSRDVRVVLSLAAILLTTLPWQAAAQGNGVPQRLAVLEALVQQLQADLAALQNAISREAAARALADTALQNNIDSEAGSRHAADVQLQSNIDAIQPATVPQSLLDLAPFVTVNARTMEGLVGPHIIFTGANVHIQSGRVGVLNTLGNPVSAVGSSYARNGLGNLVVGYNAAAGHEPVRTGSHNLIIGDGHSFTGSGGFVAGFGNWSRQDGTSVVGGWLNMAGGAGNGLFATVGGGFFNEATGRGAAISGGSVNKATGLDATVSGGRGNLASGSGATVSGGRGNTASGPEATVSGGTGYTASATTADHKP